MTVNRSSKCRGAPATHAAGALILMLVLGACSTGSSGASAASDNMASHAISAAPEAEPSASQDPLAVCEGVEPEGQPVEIAIGTASFSFDPRLIEAARHCQPFVIVFTNSDAPLPPDSPGGTNEHNITIRAENLIGPLLFDGEVIGRTTIRYEVPGLPSGEHYLYCKVHPSMTGSVLVAPAEG